MTARPRTVGTAVPVAPAVLVKDGTGNPVAGVPVNFVVTGGGGTVTGEDPDHRLGRRRHGRGWTLGKTTGAEHARGADRDERRER